MCVGFVELATHVEVRDREEKPKTEREKKGRDEKKSKVSISVEGRVRTADAAQLHALASCSRCFR